MIRSTATTNRKTLPVSRANSRRSSSSMGRRRNSATRYGSYEAAIRLAKEEPGIVDDTKNRYFAELTLARDFSRRLKGMILVSHEKRHSAAALRPLGRM